MDLDLPVLDSRAQQETSALVNYDTEAGVFRKTCPVVSAIYSFRDPSVLVGAEGSFVGCEATS
uniref:Uncharacterized protein n=1 Tax=Timema cristinae TaxID=61476 RepID=A0A7R9GWV0_TIMCR|nr:unnamed protein product [Timema cristinae]